GFSRDWSSDVCSSDLNRQPLLLPPAQPVAALAHDGVIPIGQPQDEVVDVGGAAGSFELVLGSIEFGVAQIGADGVVEQVGLLGQDRKSVVWEECGAGA